MSAESIRLLIMTCPQDQVDRLLDALLAERLIACGNVVAGVAARYWWQGALCSDSEALVVMETAASRADAAMRRIVALHPYEVPKILGFTPALGNPDYVAWVQAETRPPNVTE
ncbi:MAG: divalent-cation tolerance protein CutA [Nannocystis sp.]|nr:divalent-cation tolerance protein CutA [Nannocystis sp.]MBA3547374.1 divalent-cation tolerance protein CutA [Nannocystis sp.]